MLENAGLSARGDACKILPIFHEEALSAVSAAASNRRNDKGSPRLADCWYFTRAARTISLPVEFISRKKTAIEKRAGKDKHAAAASGAAPLQVWAELLSAPLQRAAATGERERP